MSDLYSEPRIGFFLYMLVLPKEKYCNSAWMVLFAYLILKHTEPWLKNLLVHQAISERWDVSPTSVLNVPTYSFQYFSC